MEKSIVIETRDVKIAFDNTTVVENVNFKLFKNELLVLVGPSGHGKSVLLKALTGISNPNQGEVFFCGKPWSEIEHFERREIYKKIGFLFQRGALFDSISSKENIAFPMREHTKMSEEEIHKRCCEILDSVGLSNVIDKLPHELSGGMQRRLGIARALALNPEFIFYDDPTAGLDPIFSDKIADLILELKKKYNSTVIVITNDILRAYQMADRIIMVANKEVFEVGNVIETQNSTDLRVQQFIHGRLEGPLSESLAEA